MSGVKHDGSKPDMSLLSPYALEAIAQVMTAGKAKYGADNWRGGIVFSRLYAAVMRHLTAYNRGEMKDPETGLSHLAHASCGLAMMLEFETTKPELNDLYHCNRPSITPDNVPSEKITYNISDINVGQKYKVKAELPFIIPLDNNLETMVVAVDRARDVIWTADEAHITNSTSWTLTEFNAYFFESDYSYISKA